jgi:hypothetical protein
MQTRVSAKKKTNKPGSPLHHHYTTAGRPELFWELANRRPALSPAPQTAAGTLAAIGVVLAFTAIAFAVVGWVR